MSARIRPSVSFAFVLFAAAILPGVAWEATTPPAPQGAQPVKPVDEAAAAAQESEEALRHGDGVAAVVNDTPISNYDVRQRVALYMATSGVRPTPEAVKQIRGQVLKQLETERLELLEAEKNKVSVSAQEVDKAIDDILKDNRLSHEQLNSLLSKADVRIETLRAQIAAQIAWSKLVQDALGDRVHVSALDVDDEMARLKEGANKPRYLASEIFQAVDTPEQDAKVKKDMEDLETQLQAGAPFAAVARQLSQNPTAAQGGDLGAVQDGQLPPELDKVIKTLRPGQISAPIRSSGGYYILYLRELEEPEGFKDPTPAPQPSGPPGTLPLMRILLPIGPKPPKELVDRAFQAAAVLRSQIQSCQGAHDVAKHLPGAVVMDLGNMKLADLSTEMQNALGQTEPGSSTEPLVSAAGVEILVRCDKAIPKIGHFQMPTREQVEQSIYEEQITTLARQYLRDLRRDADVEAVEKN